LADKEYILLSPFSYLIEMLLQIKLNRILALKEKREKIFKYVFICFNIVSFNLGGTAEI